MIRDLAPIEREHHLALLRGSMSDRSIESFLTSDTVSLRWLSGFTGSAGKLLIGEDSAYLLTDGRYAEQAEIETQGTEIKVCIGGMIDQNALISGHLEECKTVALEADRISWMEAEELRERIKPEVLPTSGIIANL